MATVTAETTEQASPGEASFQLLAEHLPDLIIFAFDTDLRIWAATGGGIRARGWTTEEFIGMTVPEIAGATRAEDIRACCEAALAGERAQLEMAGHDPPDRLWSLTFVPLGGPGTGDGMVLCRDVTEQRRAEELVRASQRQLAEAQRIAQVGSWEWDLATDELTVSDELCRIFGLPIGIKMTMTEGVATAIHPADRERVATALEQIRDDPSPFALEHRIIRTDGDVRTVLARGEGVVDEDGRLVRFIGTDQDITDRRRADAERRRLLNRVYEAQEGQDRRLAADLHDGHVQSLAAIGFKLRLGGSGSPEVDELLWQVTKDLSAEVTALRRTIGRLRPWSWSRTAWRRPCGRRPSRPATGPPWPPARSSPSWTGVSTRWSRRPCSGSPSRPWPTWSSTPRRPTPRSPSTAPARACGCGSATTAAGSTPTTCR